MFATLARLYGIAFVSVVVAVSLRLLLDPLLEERLPVATLFGAVIFMAWYAGRGPAYFTLAIGLVGVAYFILEPRSSFLDKRQADIFVLIFYIALGSASITLIEQLRAARARAERSSAEAQQKLIQLQNESGLRALAEAAVAAESERLRQLADAMPQIVWTMLPDGRIDYLNRRWSEFTGLAQDVSNAGWTQILNEQDAPLASERWQRSLESGTAYEMELRLFDRRTRAWRWHLVRTVPVKDAHGKVIRWFGTATDIHEQIRSAESARYLAEASSVLAGVVDYESTLQKVASLAVPYFADWSSVDIANEHGTLRQLAVAHRDSTKVAFIHRLQQEYPPDPEAPTGPYAVLRSGQPQIVSHISDELLAGSAKDARHLEILRSLELRSYICVPLRVAGRMAGVFTFATAESGRRYGPPDLELAMNLAGRASIALENAELYQALRDADRRKDEFLATLAHELRNPLAPISNSLQILKVDNVDPATIARSRDLMERQVNLLVRLVDDLLDVSRVTSGKIELHKERRELATIVASAVEMVQPLLERRGQQLVVQVAESTLAVDADPLRLAQVLGNVLTNASKFSHDGRRITLSAVREGETAAVRIRDEGIGIAPEMLGRVFQLFVQADNPTTRAHGGLGIGLTLARNLVEMHGGTIEAHSEGLGKGSEFIVRLPVARTTVGAAAVVARKAPAPTAVAAKLRLLVVDDNIDAASTLETLLRLQGHDVRIAHSGLAALDLTREHKPDAVFLDIGMPGMDGYETARLMRQQEGMNKALLVAVTGWGQQEDRRRTSAAGFDHHLVKPPEPAALQEVLKSVRS